MTMALKTEEAAAGRSVTEKLMKFMRPDFLQSVNLKQHVKLGYHYLISHAFSFVMIPLLLVAVAAKIGRMGITREELDLISQQLLIRQRLLLQELNINVSILGALVLLGTLVLYMSRLRPIYLVDFACYKPEDKYKMTMHTFIERSILANSFNEKSIDFQRKILERSGLGEETYFPPAIQNLPPTPCMKEARREAEMVMYGALDELFQKTRVKPKDIGILVVNCSLFSPTPSLSSMIVNHYKLRSNIVSLNLGGMGCSAGVIAINLAKDLLQVYANSYAIVVSMENITLNWYIGNDRSKLVTNCIFRMGGAAILLSNKRRERRRAKYQLAHVVRTHRGADDKCYKCVFQEEDEERRILGVSLSRDLMRVAGDALKANITTLGPLVLPLSEQILFFATLVARKLFFLNIKPYIPDFKLAFNHFCIHAGGRAVLDEVEHSLQLSEWHMEPSRMTLYRFGNTSSSSPWYELAYTEAKGRVKKGDTVLQIAFGSGFKCNSAVWRALRTLKPPSIHNPWLDCIDLLPVKVPTFATI